MQGIYMMNKDIQWWNTVPPSSWIEKNRRKKIMFHTLK